MDSLALAPPVQVLLVELVYLLVWWLDVIPPLVDVVCTA